MPVVQLPAHAKSSTLYGRSYGRTSKFFRLDGLLLFCIIIGLRSTSSANIPTVLSWSVEVECLVSNGIECFLSLTAYSDCTQVDWNITLGSAGWASCPLGKYLKGVLRAHISNSDGIDNIKAGQCCIPPHEFLDEDTECKTENWKKSLSR